MNKKTVELFEVKDNTILIPEENLNKLTDTDKSKIAFYSNTLGYEVVFKKTESKKRKTFTIEKAILYITENDKKSLKAFSALKTDADKVTEHYKALVLLKKLANSENATNEEKASAPKDEELKEARRLMIIAQKNAFNAQKKFFIDKYGDDAYSEVKGM